jgi:hypothetical protein
MSNLSSPSAACTHPFLSGGGGRGLVLLHVPQNVFLQASLVRQLLFKSSVVASNKQQAASSKLITVNAKQHYQLQPLEKYIISQANKLEVAGASSVHYSGGMWRGMCSCMHLSAASLA